MGFYIRVNCPISIVNIIISDPNSWISLRLAHPVVKQLEYQPPNTIGPCDKYTKTTGVFCFSSKDQLQTPRINFRHPPTIDTPLKFNMAPEHQFLETMVPIGKHHFQVPCSIFVGLSEKNGTFHAQECIASTTHTFG